MDGLEKFFVRDESFAIGHKAEFIRPVTEDIDQETCQALCFYLMAASAQGKYLAMLLFDRQLSYFIRSPKAGRDRRFSKSGSLSAQSFT